MAEMGRGFSWRRRRGRSGFAVAPKGLCWGIEPRRSWRQFGDAAGEIGEAGLTTAIRHPEKISIH
jgi:hypothetical protein